MYCANLRSTSYLSSSVLILFIRLSILFLLDSISEKSIFFNCSNIGSSFNISDMPCACVLLPLSIPCGSSEKPTLFSVSVCVSCSVVSIFGFSVSDDGDACCAGVGGGGAGGALGIFVNLIHLCLYLQGLSVLHSFKLYIPFSHFISLL